MSAETYRRWANGWCPCCGSDIDEYEDRGGTVTEPETVAEGVRICGRCIAMEHLSIHGLLEAMLFAIVRRDDAPIDELHDAVRS